MTRIFDFYIVPTPIGNISDITLRAIEVLKNVDIIACEDTRVTQKLLNHYKISTKCFSYHKYNEKERVNYIISEIKNGKRIALVSDAGTPLVCDPGNIIVEELLNAGFSVTSLPGACAVTTFLSQVPRGGEEFTFCGFISRKKSQVQTMVLEKSAENLVFYDSPERILKTMDYVKEVRGDINIAVGRELSKLFEEITVGKISEIQQHYQNGIKGEIVCLIYATEQKEDVAINAKAEKLKNKGFKAKEIATILSTLYDLNKNDIYQKLLNR